MKHGIIPADIQKLQHFIHPYPRMQHQLFVGDAQTLIFPQLSTLIVHGFHGGVPLHHALPVARQVESGYGHLPGDDGMNGGPAVPNHKDEFGVGEQIHDVGAHFNGERILVA